MSTAALQNKSYAFIRKAKSRLDSTQYTTLLDTLAKYETGIFDLTFP
jgi:hypothetical protein